MALQPSQMSVREVFEMIFANKWLFLVCVFVCWGVAFFLSKNQAKSYQSQAVIVVENPMAGDPMTSEISKAVDKVVEPTNSIEYQYNEVRKRVLAHENLVALLEAGELELPQFGKDYEQAARSIAADVSINRRNNVIVVSCTRHETKGGLYENEKAPEQAAAIANAVAKSVVAKHREVREAQLNQALDYLRDLRDKYATDLEKAEYELQTYDQLRSLAQQQDPRNVLAGISRVELHDVNSEALVTRYRDALVQSMENKIKLEGFIAKLEELDRQIKAEPAQIVTVTQSRSETHEELSKRYADALAKLASLRRTRTDEHWEVQDQILEVEEIKTQMELVKKPVVQEESFEVNPVLERMRMQRNAIAADIAELRIQQESILAEKNNLVDAIDKIRQNGTEREQLKKKVSIQTELYNDLMGRYAEAEVASELASDNRRAMRFQLQSFAAVPSKPLNYNPGFMQMMGIFIGIIAGIVLCLVREIADTSFRSLDDASRYLDMPVLGVIPEVPGTPRRRRIRNRQKRAVS